MMNMPIKIGFMIGGTLAGYALQVIGYTAGMTVTPEFISSSCGYLLEYHQPSI